MPMRNDALLRRHDGIALGHPALDVDRAARRRRRWRTPQQPVTSSLDDPPPYSLIFGRSAPRRCALMRQRRALVTPHEQRIANFISRYDCCQSSVVARQASPLRPLAIRTRGQLLTHNRRPTRRRPGHHDTAQARPPACCSTAPSNAATAASIGRDYPTPPSPLASPSMAGAVIATPGRRTPISLAFSNIRRLKSVSLTGGAMLPIQRT